MSFDPKELRKELHRIPEPAFGEHKTKALLMQYLQTLPQLRLIEFATSPGILVEYKVNDTAFKLFRADMDALPIQEVTACDFISTHPGFMHACGHDVHMAILMGMIQEVCIQAPDQNLLFLFQPAEEGKGGAESILAEGIIQSYEVSEVYALHVNPRMPLGTVSSKAGIFFAIPQEFDIRFFGKAAHAAFPEAGKNALIAGAECLVKLQEQSAKLSQEQRLIFHVGKMQAGMIRNIIADKCVLEGTHRTLNRQMCQRLNSLITETAKAIAKEYDLGYEVDFLCSYDPVVNDENLYESFANLCGDIGIDCIPSEIYMTGEDFGFFTSLYPGLLFWLGANDLDHDLHSGSFLADAASIDDGIKLFMALATK